MSYTTDRSFTEYTEYTSSFPLAPKPKQALLALVCSGCGSFHHQGIISEFEAGHCFLLYTREAPNTAVLSPELSCQISLLSFSLTDVNALLGRDFQDTAIRELFSEEVSFCHLKLLPEQMDAMRSYQKLCLSMQKDSLTIYRQTLHAMLLYFSRTLAILKPEKRQDSREFFSRSILTEQVKYLIRQNYSESLSLSDIAASVFANPSYLSRVFKEETGIPLSHYINQVRIQNAMVLLEDTEELIIDIAVACGYNYIPHFNRVFKEHTGMTPGAYRKSRRFHSRAKAAQDLES